MRFRAAAWLAILAAAAPGLAAERPALAVLDFTARNASASDAAVVADFVRAAAVRAQAWRVADKNNMDKILAEQAFQRTGCAEGACAVQLGRLLNVRQIIVGTYALFEGSRVITGQVVEVQEGRILASESVRLEAAADLQPAAERLVNTLVDRMRQPVVPAAVPVLPVTPADGDVRSPVGDLPPTRNRSFKAWAWGSSIFAAVFVLVIVLK